MNKQDQKAFEKWWWSIGYENTSGEELSLDDLANAWQAACEYKDKQYLSGKVLKTYNQRLEEAMSRVKEQQEEISKIKDIENKLEIAKESLNEIMEATSIYQDSDRACKFIYLKIKETLKAINKEGNT